MLQICLYWVASRVRQRHARLCRESLLRRGSPDAAAANTSNDAVAVAPAAARLALAADASASATYATPPCTAASTAASTAAPAPAGATASEATSPAVAAPKPGLADVPWGEVASSRPVWALTASHASYA